MYLGIISAGGGGGGELTLSHSKYIHWHRKGDACAPPFYLGGKGDNGMFVPPTFNPTFLFST